MHKEAKMSDIFTEQALRMAVNITKADVAGEVAQVSSIKDAALGRVNELIRGNKTLSGISSEANLQSIAINAAIQGIELSVFAIHNQLNNLKDKRLSFDKERQAGIATFQIRTNIEEKSLFKQEQIMKAFFELAQKNPTFLKYLGIQKSTSKELSNVEFYSVLPYYKMSDALAQPIASTKTIDKQRAAISLFFKAALPDSIADIDNNFQKENNFLEFMKSAFRNENYLNDLRAPRFLMICLANLLWNLQHPVDPEEGYPFSSEHCIELCRTAGLFLNQLLNPSEKTSLLPLSNYANKLIYYVRKVELLVKALKRAYTEEYLYELNIDDLTNNAHRTLRTLDTSVFELIYTRKDPITHQEQPDTKAAEYLASTISYFHELLIDSPDLIKFFTPFAAKAQNTPFFNDPPCTLIDTLVIFIHSIREDKDKLYQNLVKQGSDAALELLSTLKEFDERFIKPIKAVSKTELNISVFNPKRIEVARLTARRLVPLITLVLEDHRVDVDLPSKTSASTDDAEVNVTKAYAASEQVKQINLQANAGKNYYLWELSPFIDAHKETEDEIDKLPKHQYRFSEITKLLDSITEIVQTYRTFLQCKPFQVFLVNCLSKVKNEYAELGHYIEQIDSFLSKDKKLNRNMQNILGPMTTTITSSLDDFSQAFSNFEQIITAPNFTEREKNSLAAKIGSIHQEFYKLFGEDSGISAFASPTSIALPVEITPPEATSIINKVAAPIHLNEDENIEEEWMQPKQVVELRRLIINCINTSSYQSRYGHKGKLLYELIDDIDSQHPLTKEMMKETVMKLVKITLSYRPTYFFQAIYGETASAKALVAAIKNPNINKQIPLAELLLGENIDPSKETNEEIIQRLRSLQVKNKWEKSCSEIKAKNPEEKTFLCFNF